MSILACALHRSFLFSIFSLSRTRIFFLSMTPSCCDGCLVIYLQIYRSNLRVRTQKLLHFIIRHGELRFLAGTAERNLKPFKSLSTKEQHSTAQSAENEKGQARRGFSHLRHNPNHQT